MNKIILAIFCLLFLVGVVLRIVFALFFPDRFAEGARRVLFLDERDKLLFRRTEKKQKLFKSNENTCNH
jgi:hypothetical protein